MKTKGVIGEVFWSSGEFSEAQPWNQAVNCVQGQEPEGRQVDEDVAGGVFGARGLGKSLCSEHVQGPKDQATHPPREPVDSFEGVMLLSAEVGMSEDHDGCK